MKLFLIDGHALIFKMYYAFLGRPMVNGKGCDTSILFGFTKYLIELIEREHPTHLAVSFDPPGGTFRNVMFPAYKANRPETPQLVIDALEPLTRIVGAMNIPVLMIKGFEADDVIGSMAIRSAAEGAEVYMVTPDKDYGQLVGGRVRQYRPGKSGSDNEILGEAEVCAKWNISSTSQVIDMLAICGDSADNVPGVQGVGPVGAAKLLAKYGSVENIFAHRDELSPKQKAMFEEASDHIGLSKQLVTIKTDIPIDVTMDDMALNVTVTDELVSLFDYYEMPSLKRRLASIASSDTSGAAPAVHAVCNIDLPRVAPSELAPGKTAILFRDGTVFAATSTQVACGTPEEFRRLIADPSAVKAGMGLKSTLNALLACGFSLEGKLEDVELLHYVIDPERSHKLGDLCREYLGVELEPDEGGSTGSLFDDASEDDAPDAFREVAAIRFLSDRLRQETGASGMDRLYDEVEEPLVRVLARMERTGVKVDVASLRDFAGNLRAQMAASEAEVRRIAGEPGLNVGSPKQIGEVIFEKMKLDPRARKPRSGSWPTDEATLVELSDRSPIIDAILDYRGTRKLLSTYIEPFPSYISPSDGRIHSTFNQAMTSTGRLSSSNPNLQNIPIRTEQGREIRKAFVAGKEGWVMMSADYSQIELRVMAHMCGDEHLCEAFRSGVDVHSATASRIFGVEAGKVTPEQRRIAKTANFGIMYGISAFGLSQRLKCSRSEAKQIIDDYFASFPSIRGFIDRTLESARANGYVETLLGRRRYIPDINSQNGNLRSLAERNAVNAPIQGTAADIIKLAMVAVERRLAENGLEARTVLQIHDELLLEVPENEIEQVREIVVSEMEGVMSLSVPLTVECSYGKTWLEAH